MSQLITLEQMQLATTACRVAYGATEPSGWRVEREVWGNTQAVSLRLTGTDDRAGETIIAYAGSNDPRDWVQNLRVSQQRHRLVERGYTHKGFARHYEPSSDWVVRQVDEATLRGDLLGMIGHSLGASSAVHAALEARAMGSEPVRVITLGMPRMFSPRGASWYDRTLGQRTYRIVTVDGRGRHDFVPRVAPRWSGVWLYRHVGHVIVAHPNRLEFGSPAWRALRDVRGRGPAVWPWQIGRAVTDAVAGGRVHGVEVYARNLRIAP